MVPRVIGYEHSILQWICVSFIPAEKVRSLCVNMIKLQIVYEIDKYYRDAERVNNKDVLLALCGGSELACMHE